jgi:hypothetical protein
MRLKTINAIFENRSNHKPISDKTESQNIAVNIETLKLSSKEGIMETLG